MLEVATHLSAAQICVMVLSLISLTFFIRAVPREYCIWWGWALLIASWVVRIFFL